MKYLVPSIGRCGSNLIVKMLSDATKAQKVFTYSYNDLFNNDNCVIKTHLHFKQEPNGDFRTIFIYDDIEAVVASLYDIYGNNNFIKKHEEEVGTEIISKKSTSLFWKNWFKRHFQNLEMKPTHIRLFFLIAKLSKQLAFIYLCSGDKFRFKNNIKSWKNSNKTLFVKYTDLANNKEEILKKISAWVEVEIQDVEIKERSSSPLGLPFLLRKLIDRTYPTDLVTG